MKLETVRLFHCFPKQEELLLSQQSYFLEFSLFNSNYWSHPSATRAECRIRTYKPNKRPRISSPLQYHYGNSADRSRRFMTAPILSMIFQIHFWDQSSRFSNSFVGFGQIYSVYTGKVFLGTSCLVGMAWYANPNISTLYFLFAASLDFENITPIQTTIWKIIKPYEVIIIKTPSLSELEFQTAQQDSNLCLRRNPLNVWMILLPPVS